jgi:hypothetical protein
MSRPVIVKPLQQTDIKRMVGYARMQLYGKGRTAGANETSYGLGFYYRMASLEPSTDKGIPCHKCRSFILLGELFARKVSGGKPYHVTCAKQLNLI